MTDDDLAGLLDELIAAEALRATLPVGSRDREMVEQTIVVLNLRLRQSLDAGDRDDGASRATDGAH